MKSPKRLGERIRDAVPSWGACVIDLDHVDSTNALARSLGRAGAPEGTIVLARHQRAGKGRWSRTWSSAPGGLYFTVILRPAGRRLPLSVLPLLVSVTTAETLARSGLPARLSWPNDVYADGRKLAGILCESTFIGSTLDFVAAGVGVNVNQTASQFPEEILDRATSVRLLLGIESDTNALLVEIVQRLHRQYVEDDPSTTLDRFRSLAIGVTGESVRFESRDGRLIEATTAGVAGDGGLSVTLTDGSQRVLYSEEVHGLKE